jgi:hypothetical protein
VSDQPPYVVSAAYQRPNRSKTVYSQLEALLANDEQVDLSVYNLTLNGQPLVIVLGNPPPPTVHEAIQRIMATGQPVEVPASLLAALYQRSLAEWAQGPWRVHHHQSGKRYRVAE